MSFDPDKKTLIPSGYFGKTSDSIFIVENFISQEEVDELLYAAKNLDIWREAKYKNRYTDKDKFKIAAPNTAQLLDDICERWRKAVSEFYGVKIETYINPICRWPVWGKQIPHADKEWKDGSPGEQNYYDIGSVIYLNNDYEGGEIYFPDHELDIKPDPGTAVAFPGDLYFFHGVREIRKTERYAIPIFWTVLEYDPAKDQTLL